MRVVVRSDHEELVESVEEGLYHNERDNTRSPGTITVHLWLYFYIYMQMIQKNIAIFVDPALYIRLLRGCLAL